MIRGIMQHLYNTDRATMRRSKMHLVSMVAPDSLTEEEARELRKKWESAWPEISQFMRQQAAQLDRRMRIRIEDVSVED